MRALANAPTPTCLPSISTVSVPSGDAAVIVPAFPGCSALASRNSSRPGVNSSSSVMRLIVNPSPTVTFGQRARLALDVLRARDRVAVRARRRAAEEAVHRLLDGLAHDVLPLAGLVVGLGPRQVQDVGEEALGEAVPAHDLGGEQLPVGGEADALVGLDEALGLEAAHHLADGRTADVEPLGDARLDDVDVILGELEDALAVLLERRMVLSYDGHAAILTWGCDGRSHTFTR